MLYTTACLCPIQAGLHQDAAKLAAVLESQHESLTLQIAIKYEQNDIAGQPQTLIRYDDIANTVPIIQRHPRAPSKRTLQVARGCWRSYLGATLMQQ